MARVFGLKKHAFCVFIFLFLLMPFSVRADSVVVGDACTQLGTSTMSTDQQNIAACLKDTNGNLVWKSMTGGGGGVPVGTIIAWPATINPPDAANWLDCDGRAVSQTTYPALYAIVGNKVPDLRGLFLRGLGGKSATLGAPQGDNIRPITGRFAGLEPLGPSTITGPFYSLGQTPRYTVSYDDTHYWEQVAMDTSRLGSGFNDTETRPVNMAVRYLIRAK